MTVRVFLRELRGLWPGAELRVDDRALAGAEHLGLLSPGDRTEPPARLRRLAAVAGLDVRDLEAALIRLELAHARKRLSGRGGLRDPSAGTRPVGPGRY
ncbi:MAG: hypothetical protein WKF65_17960 [Gaiellaceae bacterium]